MESSPATVAAAVRGGTNRQHRRESTANATTARAAAGTATPPTPPTHTPRARHLTQAGALAPQRSLTAGTSAAHLQPLPHLPINLAVETLYAYHGLLLGAHRVSPTARQSRRGT